MKTNLKKTLTMLLIIAAFAEIFFAASTNPGVNAAPVIIDSYSMSNQDYNTALSAMAAPAPIEGQTFVGDGSQLSYIQVQLRQTGNPTATINARITDYKNVFGSNSVPDDSIVYATSNNTITANTINSTGLTLYTFFFSPGVTLLKNKVYALEVYLATGLLDGSHYLMAGTDTSSPTHPGNYAICTSGTWANATTIDMIFYVYGNSWTLQANEQAGLNFNSWDTQQGQTAQCGIYYIYAFDQRLLFYTNDAQLAKTYDLPLTVSIGTLFQKTSIITLDSNNLIVAATYYNPVNNYTYVDTWTLNVNTLTATPIYQGNRGANTGPSDNYDQILCNVNGSIYLVYDSRGNAPGGIKSWVERLYPTYAAIGNYTTAHFLFSSSIWIQSQTDSQTIYIVTRNNPAGVRYNIDKLNLATATFSFIGTSGIDNDYGGDVYYIGFNYQNVSGNLGYNIAVAYPHLTINQRINTQIVQFNDTAINPDYIQALTPTNALINKLRILSVNCYNNDVKVASNNGALPTNASIYPVYVGGGLYNYLLNQIPVMINTYTNPPTWSYPVVMGPPGPGVPYPYGGANGLTLIQSYGVTSTDIGGYQVPYWNMMVYFDYASGRALSVPVSAIAASITHSDILAPQPITSSTDTNTGWPVLQVYTDTQYMFGSQIQVNGFSNVTGYVAVFVNSAQYATLNIGNLGTQSTYWSLPGQLQRVMNPQTGMAEGSFAIPINPRNWGSTASTWHFSAHLTSYYGYTLDWSIIIQPVDRGSGYPANPNATPDMGTTANMSTNQLMALLIPGAIYIGLALMLTILAGFNGLIISINLSTIVCGIVMLVPPWVIVLVGVLDIAIIFGSRLTGGDK